MLELSGGFSVHPEIGLEWHVYLNTLGNVQERTSAPYCTVKGSEFIVSERNSPAEIVLHKVRIVPDCGIKIHEYDSLVFPYLLEIVVYTLAVILGDRSGKVLLLHLRDAQFGESVLYLIGHFVPVVCLGFSRPVVVAYVLPINSGEVWSPRWHWF